MPKLDAYKLDNFKLDGAIESEQFFLTAGTDLTIATASGNLAITASEYAKYYEFKVLYPGIVRYIFSLFIDGVTGNSVYGKVYINGVAVGTERSITRESNGSGTSTFNEDFTVKAGDLVQLYAYKTGGTCNFGQYSSVTAKIATPILAEVITL